jgi:hypothetical protein
MLLLGLVVLTVRRWSAFIRRWYGKLLDWTIWSAGRVLQRKFASRFSLKRYCELQLAAAESKYLELPAAFNKALETDRAFVPLLLDEGRGGDLTFSHETLLEAGARVRIIGDPGSGKSSLVKRLFRDACQEALSSPKSARLPIRIELKDFVPPDDVTGQDELAEWALTRLQSTVVRTAAFDMEGAFESYSNDPRGGLLVLLDGLDEVPANAYPNTAAAIRALSRRLENMSERSRIFLTMREQFHVQVASDFSGSFPRTLQIRPLTPNDIFRFLTQWPFDAGKTGQGEVNRIYGELTDRPTLRAMCTNPLVLAMYVATDERTAHTAELPETRSRFYAQVVAELLISRRARQVGAGPTGVARKREREAILGRLALDHLLDGDQSPNAIPWRAAVETTRDVLGLSDEETAEEYLRRLATDTGLFTEERERESLRFLHLTFCEFFAAQEATDGRPDGWDQLVSAHRSFSASAARQVASRLSEVVPFAVGLLGRSRLDSALNDVRGLNDAEILARCFLETQKYDHPSWEPFARERVAQLASEYAENWNERWLRQLSLLSVVLREAERWTAATGSGTSAPTLEEFFGGLVGDDHDRLVRVFSSFASEDPAASFRLAEASGVDLVDARPDLLVEGCADPPFLALALERAEAESDEPRTWPRILAEASLRYQVVAETLNERNAPSAWAARAQRVGRQCRWDRIAINSGKLHGVALSLGCAEERRSGDTSCFPMLKTLSFARAPAARTPDWVIRVLTFLAMSVAVLSFSYLLDSQPFLVKVVLTLVAYIVMLGLSAYLIRRRVIYSGLANLRSGPASGSQRMSVHGSADQMAKTPVERELPKRYGPRREAQLLVFSDRLRSGIGRVGVELLHYRFHGSERADHLVIERSDGRLHGRLRWRDGEATLEAVA